MTDDRETQNADQDKTGSRVVRVEYVTTYYGGETGNAADDPDPLRAREVATLAALRHLEAVSTLMRLVAPPAIVDMNNADDIADAMRGLGELIHHITQNLCRLTDIEAGEL